MPKGLTEEFSGVDAGELFQPPLQDSARSPATVLQGPCDPIPLYSIEAKVTSNGQISSQEGILFYSQKIVSKSGGPHDLIFAPVSVPAGFRLLLHAIEFQTDDPTHIAGGGGDYTGYPFFFLMMAPIGSNLNLAANVTSPEQVVIPGEPAITLFSSVFGSSGPYGSLISLGGKAPLVTVPGGFALYGVAQQVDSTNYSTMVLYGVLVKDKTIEANRNDY